MKETKTGQLYRVAAFCAALSFLFGIWAFWVQNNYVEHRFAQVGTIDRFIEGMTADYAAARVPFYDLTALYGLGILFPFLAAFATVCLLSCSRQKTRRTACLVLGVGFLSYAGIAMAMKGITTALMMYFEAESGGEELLWQALLRMAEHNFFELIFIALFALSLIITGYTQKYRPLAVSMGAICIYRLISVNAWLITAPFNGFEGESMQVYLHGILFFLTLGTAFASAVLVSMSDPEELSGEVKK